jgi:hypothetical protein
MVRLPSLEHGRLVTRWQHFGIVPRLRAEGEVHAQASQPNAL